MDLDQLKRAIMQNSRQIDNIIKSIENTDDINELQRKMNMLIKLQKYQLWYIKKLEEMHKEE